MPNMQKPDDEVYGIVSASISGQLLLGDTELALITLGKYTQWPDFGFFGRALLERSPVYDPIREEPAFIALLDDYRNNATEQREILQAKNEDTFTQ